MLLIGVGGTLSFACCIGWFVVCGAFPALVDTFLRFTPQYTALGWQGQSLAGLLVDTMWLFATGFSLTISSGMLLSVLLAKGRRPQTALLLWIIAIQLLGVALQAKSFPYHFSSIWPLAALLASVGWFSLWQQKAPTTRLLAAAAFSASVLSVTATKDLAAGFWDRAKDRLAAIAAQPPLMSPEDRDRFASVADVDAAQNRQLSETLKQRLPANASIYVWGFEPALYDLSSLRLASPYLYNIPQRVVWAAPASRKALMVQLNAAAPEAIIVTHGDVLPMVTGHMRDSASELRSFPELQRLLTTRYGKLRQIGDFEIYVRR